MAGPRHCGARRQTQIADRQHPARRCTESNAVGRNPVQGRRTSPASAEGDPGKGIATKRHINFFHNSFLCNKDATFSFLDKVFGTAHSPPRRGGESATSKTKGSVPICRGRGGQFGTPSKASRTDHYYGFALLRSRFAPVCAAFEASPYRARALRPPLRGGEYSSQIKLPIFQVRNYPSSTAATKPRRSESQPQQEAEGAPVVQCIRDLSEIWRGQTEAGFCELGSVG